MKNNHLFVLFGATGDLAKKKIFPALYNLDRQGLLDPAFRIIGIGRRTIDDCAFRDMVRHSMQTLSRFDRHEEDRIKFLNRISYYSMNFDDEGAYTDLCSYITKNEKVAALSGNRFYYLATAPRYFGLIAKRLKQCDLVRQGKYWTRVGIEKPFGRDLKSATAINEQLTETFTESNIYRIDHYLGKTMVQNIMALRFTNPIIHALWCKEFIDHVQIQVKEQVGIGERGRYYDRAGALRDMVQNHLLQMLALVGMEPPVDLTTQSLRDEKVKVLNAITLFHHRDMATQSVFGQYVEGDGHIGYLEEEHIMENSRTETFAALKVQIDNERWRGVPFYLMSGKGMDEKIAKVIIQFKSNEYVSQLFPSMIDSPNRLVIKIQPEELVSIKLNANQISDKQRLVNIDLDYCHNCSVNNHSPEAYEVLLLDMLKGDQSMFTRWDEIESSWRFIDKLNEACYQKETLTFDYVFGSDGPLAHHVLVERDGRRWW